MALPSRLVTYLAGKVPKGSEIGAIPDWRAAYAEELKAVPNLTLLSPENSDLDEGEPMTIMGHDCSLVQSADLIIVNASTKLGVGTAQEMVIAKLWSKPVLTVLPRDTHHRRTDLMMHGRLIPDWIHPFIFGFSDQIFESVVGIASFLRTSKASELLQSPKSIEVIDEAIREYQGWMERTSRDTAGL
jgi:hypothetical protein